MFAIAKGSGFPLAQLVPLLGCTMQHGPNPVRRGRSNSGFSSVMSPPAFCNNRSNRAMSSVFGGGNCQERCRQSRPHQIIPTALLSINGGCSGWSVGNSCNYPTEPTAEQPGGITGCYAGCWGGRRFSAIGCSTLMAITSQAAECGCWIRFRLVDCHCH